MGVRLVMKSSYWGRPLTELKWIYSADELTKGLTATLHHFKLTRQDSMTTYKHFAYTKKVLNNRTSSRSKSVLGGKVYIQEHHKYPYHYTRFQNKGFQPTKYLTLLRSSHSCRLFPILRSRHDLADSSQGLEHSTQVFKVDPPSRIGSLARCANRLSSIIFIQPPQQFLITADCQQEVGRFSVAFTLHATIRIVEVGVGAKPGEAILIDPRGHPGRSACKGRTSRSARMGDGTDSGRTRDVVG